MISTAAQEHEGEEKEARYGSTKATMGHRGADGRDQASYGCCCSSYQFTVCCIHSSSASNPAAVAAAYRMKEKEKGNGTLKKVFPAAAL
jgi:hypothetical protein